MNNKILLVEDDKGISRILEIELKHQGYIVDIAYDGEEGLKKFKKNFYNILLLDLMIPIISGEEVCKEIRENSEIPIIIITAKDKVLSKVNLLELGADDYLTKPFEMDELFARIKVAIRNKKDYLNKSELTFKDIKIDINKGEVFKGGVEVNLTKKEFDLLELLLLNQNIVLTREKILVDIWGYDYEGVEKTVDVFINSLRKKIDKDKTIIQSVRGRGYIVK